MLSTPPATKHIGLAGDDALRRHGDGLQARRAKRLTVTPDAVTGRPAFSAIWRAMLLPGGAFGVAQPMMTSSHLGAVDAGALHGVLHGVAAQVAPWVMLKSPSSSWQAACGRWKRSLRMSF